MGRVTIGIAGPDDDGIHADGPCAIGMRRLSIIDLEGGHQPLSNEDGTLWLVCNGEIYNYPRAARRTRARRATGSGRAPTAKHPPPLRAVRRRLRSASERHVRHLRCGTRAAAA